MARTDTLGNFLTDVAEAIRAKKGTTDTITASDFDTEISNLSTGGGGKYAPRHISFIDYSGSELDSELRNLDIVNLTSMKNMFKNCTSLTMLNLSLLSNDLTNIVNMESFCAYCSKLTSLDLSYFTNTNNITNFFSFATYCSRMTVCNLGEFDVTGATTLAQFFENCQALETINGVFITSDKLTTVARMFNGCYKMTNAIDIVSTLNTSNVTSFIQIFGNNRALVDADISNIDFTSATSIGSMFNNCYALESFRISNENTHNLTDMSSMFYPCSKLKTVNFEKIDTSAVKNMSSMFNSCSTLTSLDLTSFDTSNVTNMGTMFNSCSSLTYLNISTFDFSKVTSFSNMFNGIPVDCLIIVKSDAEKEWVLARRSDFTNVKTLTELETEEA